MDREGRAHWPDGYGGSVDVGQYDLYTAADGEPRFLPRGLVAESIVGPFDGWSDGFGEVRHGCGPINAMVRMPNGDLILGGGFLACGNVFAEGIVRWDGHKWSALQQPPTSPGIGPLVPPAGAIYALALRGSDLIAAGEMLFGTAEGDQFNVARWDGNAWHALVPGALMMESNNSLVGVRSITVVGSDVYFGGDIGDVEYADSSPRLNLHNLARWDGSAWRAVVGTNPGCDQTSPGVDGFVNALATDGSSLYVGGTFLVVCSQANDSLPGVPANHVARFNGGTWGSLGTGNANGVDGVVNALAYASGSLYAGGSFQTAGTTQASGLARWDGSTWASVGTGAENGVSSTVNALALFNGKLFAGGTFRFAGSVSAFHVAQWDASKWSALAQGLGTASPADTDTSSVNAIVADNAGTYALGSFTVIEGGDAANGVARWNGSAWQPLIGASDFTQIDGRVNALVVHGGDLYVGGLITRVGELPVNNVARWNGSAWSSLGLGSGNGVDGEVLALSSTTTSVYVGGAFAHAGGFVANHVARWDGGAWHPLGSGTGNGTDGTVRALASAADASVYAGGDFIHAGGQVANSIAMWNASAWSALPLGAAVGVCGSVDALAPSGTGVYVGGSFPSGTCPAGSASVGNNVAYWSGSQWGSLAEPLAIGDGVNGLVSALFVAGTDLYIGGRFSQVSTASGILSVSGVVRWRNGAWNRLGTAGQIDSGFVLSLGMLQGKVYAGTGVFSATIWRFDEQNSTWRAINANGSDTRSINALAGAGSKLYVGGSFFEISAIGAPSAASSAWALYQLPVIFANGFDP